jgi:hypothetical protein
VDAIYEDTSSMDNFMDQEFQSLHRTEDHTRGFCSNSDIFTITSIRPALKLFPTNSGSDLPTIVSNVLIWDRQTSEAECGVGIMFALNVRAVSGIAPKFY